MSSKSNPVADSALDEKEKLVPFESREASKAAKRLGEKGLVSYPERCFYTPAVHSGGGCVGEA